MKPHAFAAALALAGGLSLSLPASAAAHLEVGQAAPDLTFRTPAGEVRHISAYGGQVVILAFWATWCAPCREELPLLSDYASRHPRVKVVALALDGPDNLAEVQAATRGLKVDLGLLPSAWAGDYGRVWKLPVSFVIDPAGRLQYDGWKADLPIWDKGSLEQVVTPLLRTATVTPPAAASPH